MIENELGACDYGRWFECGAVPWSVRAGVCVWGVWCVWYVGLRGGPLLVKLVGVEVFGRVMRVVHTWRLRGGRGAVVLGGGVPRRAAVRRALPVRTR